MNFPISCPTPVSTSATIQMAHGGGGRRSHDLIERLFLPAFCNQTLEERHDGAVLDVCGQKLAFTTDSHVVSPLFFPGGDIGKLAVCGTVNDLLMCGARPRWLSVGFILEEGLSVEVLERVVASMSETAAEAGVQVVTGDTKVVDRGKGDGIYINTAGIGTIAGEAPSPARVRSGDVILLSGDIGRHGIAVMAQREGLAFESMIESDCALLSAPVVAMLEAGVEIHCLRDLTRGGLATALVEIAKASGNRCRIDERAIPVREDVRGACEILGLDPLYVANEGRFMVILPENEVSRALEILRSCGVSEEACRIGEVCENCDGGEVLLRGTIGVDRILDMLSGEQLPRIC